MVGDALSSSLGLQPRRSVEAGKQVTAGVVERPIGDTRRTADSGNGP